MRGTNQTSRVWGAAVGVTLLLTVSACSDGDDDVPTEPTFVPVESTPAPEPSESVSVEPSEEPTAEALVAPELPAAATEETPEGAAAFAEWWFETLNYATATGDTSQVRASFAETCETCENLASRIEDAYSAGGDISGGAIRTTVDVPTQLEEGGVALAMQIDAEGGAIRDGEGDVISELEAEQLASVMAVLFIDGTWIVGGIQ